MPKTKSNENKKLATYIVALIILFLLPVVLILASNTSTVTDLPLSSVVTQVKPEVKVPFASATLDTNSSVWSTSGIYTVDVNIDDSKVSPETIFYLLRLNYLPDDITVESIDANSYWTGQNVVAKHINEEDGEITIIVGRAFDESAKRTNTKKAVTLTFTVNDTTTSPETALVLNPISYLTPSGTADSVNLTSEPLVVVLE